MLCVLQNGYDVLAVASLSLVMYGPVSSFELDQAGAGGLMDLCQTARYASALIAASGISYVQNKQLIIEPCQVTARAKVAGLARICCCSKSNRSEWEEDTSTGTRCLIKTDFDVDHASAGLPEAVAELTRQGKWQLGPLIAGHEFFAVVCCADRVVPQTCLAISEDRGCKTT